MVTSMIDLDIDGLLNESKIKLLTAFNNGTAISEIEASANAVDDAMDQVDELLDGHMTEYDKALFAEVDKLSNSAMHPHSSSSSFASADNSSITNSIQHNIHTNNETDSSEKLRPLSPESLFDELSVSNSPLLNKDHHQSSQENYNSIIELQKQQQQLQQQQENINRGLQQIQEYDSLLKNYNELREEYSVKCKELDKVLTIFKEMETKRFELTQENQYLRTSLSQLLFRSSQEDINLQPFQL